VRGIAGPAAGIGIKLADQQVAGTALAVLGEMAMRMLLDRIAGRNAQQGIVIEPDPIWRATTPRLPG
jgi:hypothetical protein